MLIDVNINGAERRNIKRNVMRSIDESQPHSIFFISDYADFGAAETIRKILHEATITGVLEKAGHGIYIKPKISRFGKVPVPLEKIAREIAERDKCEILPTLAQISCKVTLWLYTLQAQLDSSVRGVVPRKAWGRCITQEPEGAPSL